MITDLGSTDSSASEHCAVCVVGGGIAGLLVAAKLSAAGRRVIVLESGTRSFGPQHDDLHEIEQEIETYQTAVSGRTRGLGGTSALWGGRMMPLTPHDMGPRAYLDLPGWPISKRDLDRHLPEIEALFRLDGSSYEHLSGRARPHARALPMDHDDLVQRWSKWPTFARRNVAHVLGQVVLSRRNLDIRINATVVDFLTDPASGRLLGVMAVGPGGVRLGVSADCFVIACGTLESTRLLLLLDAATHQRAFAGCDALGRYLHDHLAVEVGHLKVVDERPTNHVFGYHVGGATRRSLHLETTPGAQQADRVASGYITIRPEFGSHSIQHFVRTLGKSAQRKSWLACLPSAPVIWDAKSLVAAAYWRARHRQMYFGPRVDLFVDARVEQVPNAQSRLTLSRSTDRLGMPKLRMDWRKTSADDRALQSVSRRAKRFWRSTVLDMISPIEWSSDPEDRNTTWIDRTRDTRHPAGTARMGHDPRASVVNPDLACHAVPNLYVASAAVFPCSGSANPTLTIMQLALRAADSILSASA